MANRIVNDTSLTSVANAIREKAGTSGTMAFPAGFVSAIGNIPTGGGGSSDGDVVFIDYDGTVVASKTKAEITAMTSDSDLPAFPTHTGLTAQGWNWTVAQLKAQLTAMPDQKVYVGQMYVTTSGATEIDVVMHEGRLNPALTIAVKGEVSVDWGDNTTPDTVTGASETTRKAVNHTYASAGSYTICISKVSGTYSLYGSTSEPLLRHITPGAQVRVYSNCVRSIRIGTGITHIRAYAFVYCCSLTSITIPSNITASIGGNAFNYCYCLKSITIPNGVTSIESTAFEYCSSLSSVAIPSGVTSIGSNVFSHCDSLMAIAIPNSVTSIGNAAFYYSYSLRSVVFPSGITSISNSMFQYCNSLANVIIPSSVTSIGTSAFYGCHCLTSITIPSNVTSIGSSAFYENYSLTSITIPSNVTSIETSTFYGCYSIESIIIPNNVTTIAATAFQNCYCLTSITIPSSVTSIGNNAFRNLYGIKEYHFQSTSVPTAGTTIFNNIASDTVIYVPFSADHSILEAYKTASNWSTYASYMQEEPS